MKSDKSFTIRSYRNSDRDAVRRLCCQTGFLGDPIDPVYEDRELFADFLTTYYTDHEPESCFLLEVDGEIRGYLLGSRKPLRNQLSARSRATFTITNAHAALFDGPWFTAGGKCPRGRAGFRIFTSICSRMPAR